jgi:hypothetical protein
VRKHRVGRRFADGAAGSFRDDERRRERPVARQRERGNRKQIDGVTRENKRPVFSRSAGRFLPVRAFHPACIHAGGLCRFRLSPQVLSPSRNGTHNAPPTPVCFAPGLATPLVSVCKIANRDRLVLRDDLPGDSFSDGNCFDDFQDLRRQADLRREIKQFDFRRRAGESCRFRN